MQNFLIEKRIPPPLLFSLLRFFFGRFKDKLLNELNIFLIFLAFIISVVRNSFLYWEFIIFSIHMWPRKIYSRKKIAFSIEGNLVSLAADRREVHLSSNTKTFYWNSTFYLIKIALKSKHAISDISPKSILILNTYNSKVVLFIY